MSKRSRLISIIILLMLMLAAPAAAQTQTPPTATPRFVVVSGKIINRTSGGTVPAKLDLMLHAWDQNQNEQLMRDGQSNPDGAFRFENVPVAAGLSYGVMAIYNDITYFSTLSTATGLAVNPIEIPIYEMTTDSSKIQIDQMYVWFLYTPGGLKVAEVYNVVNLGDRTIRDAVKLADGRGATLQFPLPADAFNIAFNPADQGQFARTPDGFAYAEPLVPGAKPRSIAIQYVLPYQSGRLYTIHAPYPMGGVSYLVESDSGLTVTGDGLTAAKTQKVAENRQMTVVTHGALLGGGQAIVTLSGQPKVSDIGQPVSARPAADPASTPAALLGFAGIIITLGMIAFGVWWFRRPEPVLAPVATSDEPLGQDLSDDSHARRESAEETHPARHTAILRRVLTLMQDDDQDQVDLPD